MQENLHRDQYWLITFSLDNPLSSISSSGNTVRQDKSDRKITVTINEPFIGHRLLHVDDTNVELETFPGNVHSTFFRVVNNTAYMSNNASLLMKRGETLKLDSFVLLQQLSASASPLDDLFIDISKLEAASIYSIDQSGITYQRSALHYVKNATTNDAFEIIDSEFAKYCKDGNPLLVLLSGGYDSRLNLVMAMRHAYRNGNPVYTFHEFKTSKEHDIAQSVADMYSIPFSSVTRNSFGNRYNEVLLDNNFLNYHNGILRDLVVRWGLHLNWIKSDIPSGTIIGLGSEAHKGKYYYKIRNVRQDAEKYFGVKVQELEIDYFSLSGQLLRRQSDFFNILYERSEFLENKYSRIDFIHYHTYASKHSGARSSYFNHFHSIPFPFLNNDFLSVVFSLPISEKINAKLPVNFMKKVSPGLVQIPFISGNVESYEKPSYAFIKKVIRKIRPNKRSKLGVGESEISVDEELREAFDGANSDITRQLQDYILKGGDASLKIRWNFAILMYLYLRHLEKTLSVTFELQ